MFPLCSVLTPHHSALPTGEMTVRNWEERRRAGGGPEWRGGNWQSPVSQSEDQLANTEPQPLYFLYSFSCLGWWLWGCSTRIIKLKNIEHSVILKDFIRILFSKISCGKLEEQTSLSLFTSLTPTTSTSTSGIQSTQLQWNVRNVQFCHYKLRETISGRVMAWWLDGLYL